MGVVSTRESEDFFKNSRIADEELTGEQYVELVNMTGRRDGKISGVLCTA